MDRGTDTPDNARRYRFELRVSREELNQLQALSDERGVSAATVVRDLVADAAA